MIRECVRISILTIWYDYSIRFTDFGVLSAESSLVELVHQLLVEKDFP
jgi:hypothetical protein